MQVSLSTDLIEISAEINTWKQQAGQAVFEIGKRLKHVKENDLAHGQWESWLESVDINARTARAMIQAYEQFGNRQTSTALPTGKIFEMLSLPEAVDRESFVQEPHVIPSTGEEKTVDEMTVKELREVKKALQQAEQRAAQAEVTASVEANSAKHFEKLWQQAKNQPPRVETKTVEVVPDHLKKKLEKLEFDNNDLKHGYQSAKDKLKEYELRKVDDYDAEQSQRELEKLQKEADLATVNVRIAFKQFVEKAAITNYMHGAIATASQMEKERLNELVEAAEQILNQTKLALRGRRLGVVNE